MIDKQLKALLKNVSNDGLLSQMIRGEFLEQVIEDSDLAMYLIENCNIGNKLNEIVEAYRKKSDTPSYELDKKIILKYAELEFNGIFGKVHEAYDIFKRMPYNEISDQEFIDKFLSYKKSSILFYYDGITKELESNDWFIPLLFKHKELPLKNLFTYDDSNHERNLEAVKIDIKNYDSLSLKAQGNPLLIEYVLEQVVNKNNTILAREIELRSIITAIMNFENQKEILMNDTKVQFADNHHLVKVDNYKSFFIENGTCLNSFSKEDLTSVIKVRDTAIETIGSKSISNKGFIATLLGEIAFDNPALKDNTVIYEVLDSYKRYLERSVDKLDRDDISNLKTILSKSNSEVKVLLKQMKENEMVISSNMDKLEMLRVLKNITPILFQSVLEKDSNSNKSEAPKTRVNKF